jgi:aerobic carbon-monoxide dehydrogenase large subunit
VKFIGDRQIDHLETPSPLNALGLKGVGKSGTLPVATVVASVVEDADPCPSADVPNTERST